MTFRNIMTLILLAVLVTVALSSETAPEEPRIIHVPVNSLRQNEKLVVEARVDGATSRVVYMRLYYRSQGEQSYDYIEMRQGSVGFFAELSPSRFSLPEVEYFILALLGNQEVVTYPERNPYGSPIAVQIASGAVPEPKPRREQPPVVQPPGADTTYAETEETPRTETVSAPSSSDSPILTLSPEQGETFSVGDELVVAASYDAQADSIDIHSLNLIIDGNNVTLDADVSDYLITYTTTVRTPGTHRIHLQGYYQSGVELPASVWTFEVEGEMQEEEVADEYREPIASGRVYAESRQENISDQSFSDNSIGGIMSGKYGIAEYNARLYLTTREDAAFQPRNRYSFNLDIPVLGVTLGDTYPRFNDLMLWGKRVRGVHARAHFGFINFDFITGETTRRVQQTTIDTLTTPTTPDTTTSVTPKQDLLGLRTSFGSGENFQLGFNMVKVRDDTTSLRGADTFLTLPQDNLVVGSDLLLAFANRRIEFRAAVAFSLLSQDISGGVANKDSLEKQYDVDLPFDPADFSDYLIINSSTTPLDPRDLTSLAYNFNLRFNFLNHNIQAGYKSIGSQYTSLGNSFLRTNLRGFYINDRFRLFENRLYLNLGFEHYLDNFDADNANPSTTLQTVNTGVSFFPGQGFPSLTLNLRNHRRDNGSNSLFVNATDITPTGENTHTQDLSVQMNYDTRIFDVNHTVSASYILSDRNDEFNSARLNSGLPSTETSSNVQVLSVRTRYNIPLVTTFNFARNDNQSSEARLPNGSTRPLNSFEFTMFGAKAEYYFFNNRLETHAGFNLTSSEGVNSVVDSTKTPPDLLSSSITDYTRTMFNLGARYEISPGHYFLIDGSLIFFNDSGVTFDRTTPTPTVTQNPSFTDRIFRLYYEKRF